MSFARPVHTSLTMADLTRLRRLSDILDWKTLLSHSLFICLFLNSVFNVFIKKPENGHYPLFTPVVSLLNGQKPGSS